MRRPNHASRFEGIAKTNLQASRASDKEILQSQVNKAAKKRLSLNGLEILHGRLTRAPREQRTHQRSGHSKKWRAAGSCLPSRLRGWTVKNRPLLKRKNKPIPHHATRSRTRGSSLIAIARLFEIPDIPCSSRWLSQAAAAPGRFYE